MYQENIKRFVEMKIERQVGRYLRTLKGKENLPRPVFEGVLKILPGISYEVVPLFVDRNGSLQVFLTKRDDKDKYWPGMWHCPGAMVLNSEFTNDTLSGAWERLKATEFGSKDLKEPVRVDTLFLDTRRGKEVAVVHFLLAPHDLPNGQYFHTDNLPANLIDHHQIIIDTAVRKYKQLNDK